MRHYVNIRNAGIVQGLPAHCTRTTGDEEESFLATFGGGTGVTGGLFSGTVTVQFCIQGL